jgi:fructoselysine-6-P-deglycase FrlB-like protein
MSTFDTDCSLTNDVLAAWPAAAYPEVRRQFRPDRRLLLVAEGSSQLMPGAFVRACARTWGWSAPVDAVGGRALAGLDLAGSAVIAISNSGRSREVVEAMPRLPADATALVGIPGGQLTALPHRVLLPRAEAAVPATASVFATCLALAHGLAEACGKDVPVAQLRAAVAAELAAAPIVLGGAVNRVYWLGGHAGVGSELALKTMETTGLVGLDLPGSLGLHGIHEVLAPGDLVVANSIDAVDLPELRKRVETQCGARLHLPVVPELGVWTPLLQLVHGWRVLAAVAAGMGRDPAVPRRATKIGNPVGG